MAIAKIREAAKSIANKISQSPMSTSSQTTTSHITLPTSYENAEIETIDLDSIKSQNSS